MPYRVVFDRDQAIRWMQALDSGAPLDPPEGGWSHGSALMLAGILHARAWTEDARTLGTIELSSARSPAFSNLAPPVLGAEEEDLAGSLRKAIEVINWLVLSIADGWFDAKFEPHVEAVVFADGAGRRWYVDKGQRPDEDKDQAVTAAVEQITVLGSRPMGDDHAATLLDIAPEIARQFRIDPRIAALIDPAVRIDADEEGFVATIIERLEIVGLLAAFETEKVPGFTAPSPEGKSILIVLADARAPGTGVSMFNLPDPRTEPTSWPWSGSST